ncbi:uncharacterized protein LOC109847877 [Asparagus officinalis]|uniref:uncharacterized protein LOC109847877 n=1 Tax=Asparagus officinalis TaxID=4686 RepID=UPI00098E20DD|nr:uncharacterized protein LOC109847877 [Asparagus officinalis]
MQSILKEISFLAKRIQGFADITQQSLIEFWEDRWIGVNSLSSLFPSLYSLIFSSNVSIRSQGHYLNNLWHWHPLLKRSITTDSQYDKFHLLNLINQQSITNQPDNPRWSLTANGSFTVKSFYDFLNSRGIKYAFYKVAWNLILPSKIQIFTWLLSLNRLHTKDNLIKKGWQGDSNYIFCGTQAETKNHIFFSCNTAKSIWIHFGNYFLPFIWPSSLEELLISVTSLRKLEGIIWRTLFSAVCWSIWISRNKFIFEQKSFSAESIINLSILALQDWAGSGTRKEAVQLAKILEDKPIPRCSG